jgi:hypothetical protein
MKVRYKRYRRKLSTFPIYYEILQDGGMWEAKIYDMVLYRYIALEGKPIRHYTVRIPLN